MSNLRKILGVLLTMTFVVFALPASAGATDKLYSISMSVDPSNSSRLTATVTNASPLDGNSSFNSFDLSVDLGWTIVSVEPLSDGQADLSIAGHLRISNLNPVRPTDSRTVTFRVSNSPTSLSCGDGRWSVVVYTGSNFGGGTFDPADPNNIHPLTSVECGALQCNSALFTVQYGSTVKIKRGFNSDGTTVDGACDPVKFYVTDTLAALQQVHVGWTVLCPPEDLLCVDAPDGAFSYIVNGPLPNPKLAWKNADGTSANATGKTPAYLSIAANPALVCNTANSENDFLPRPYGKLAEAILATDTKFKVDPTGGVTRPAVPFHAIIHGERVLVTKVVAATNTWTVVRAQASTTADPLGYPAGTPVMYTPLKVLPTPVGVYAGNTQVQMCLTPTSPTNGPYTIIDVKDGWFGTN